MSRGYHEEGASQIDHALPRLTADDLQDLSRWSFAQFADEAMIAKAFDRYHTWLEKQTEISKREREAREHEAPE